MKWGMWKVCRWEGGRGGECGWCVTYVCVTVSHVILPLPPTIPTFPSHTHTHTHTHTYAQNPPLHLVAFGPKGRLVTAAVESNIVKLWPPISPNSSIVTTPESSITVTHKQNVKEPGCVYRLVLSDTVELLQSINQSIKLTCTSTMIEMF